MTTVADILKDHVPLPDYTYPVKFTYRRQCDKCEMLVDCDVTVFSPGKVLYAGMCGHLWNISGESLEKWLDSNKKFTQ
jgi:hypothetical protein